MYIKSLHIIISTIIVIIITRLHLFHPFATTL